MTELRPSGYTLWPRQRVTWIRWDARKHRMVTSHPYAVMVTEPDGNMRSFATKRAALEWIAEQPETEAE